MEEEPVKKVYDIAFAVQVVATVAFFAAYALGIDAPRTALISISFLAWGFRIGWEKKHEKGGE